MFPRKLKTTHKYNAKKTSIDGVTFDSALESRIYLVLKANNITPELQTEFVLQDGFRFDNKAIRPIKYKADFVLKTNKHTFVLDAKGMILPEAKLKAKLFMYKHNNVIIYLKSAKQAQLFCELLFDGKSPVEIKNLLNKKDK